jgi:radical SAM superfamily enzyme YgiQ (UPF0313 family)
VSRPNRYLGNALHAPKKPLDRVDVKVCLALADAYEIGMSHLGCGILHHILNRRPDVAAEFCFSPWPDAEAAMRESGQKLWSLESHVPLCEFDLLGISLQYELHYTNVLNLLDLGGIPLHASARGEDDPIVVGGGHAAFNAEPMADFFDAFVVGDGEELTLLVVDEVKAVAQGLRRPRHPCSSGWRSSRACTSRRATTWCRTPRASCARARRPAGPRIVRSVWVESLAPENYPDKPMVSLSEITHDRLAVEVMRGCTRGLPLLPGGDDQPAGAAEGAGADRRRGARRPGADRLRRGLAALALDHRPHRDRRGGRRDHEEPVRRLVGRVVAAVDAPGHAAESLAKTMTEGKKPHITLAPEAGTQRMRDVINKGVCEDELLESVDIAARQGYSGAKLYFMIGLPGERPEDLVGIVDLAKKALAVGKKQTKGRFTVTVSISPHVPKVQTPFQWETQDESRLIEQKVRILRTAVKGSPVVLKWRDSETAFLEGVFSRGDPAPGARGRGSVAPRLPLRRLDRAPAVRRLDGRVRGPRHRRAGVPGPSADEDEPQPWDHIESAGHEKFLQKERAKAKARR